MTHARLSSLEDRFFEFAKIFAVAVVFTPWYPPCSEIGRWKRHTLLHSEAPLKFDIFLGDPGSEDALSWPPNASVSSLVETCSDINMRSFAAVLEHKTKGRTFFVTSRGYMGLGPPHLEVGDAICVFPGHSVPVIMHKADSYYKHRGECFVLGVMDGEVMEHLEKGTVSLEEFEIH